MTRSFYATDLSTLLANIYSVPAVLDTRIHGISIDSREVTKGDLFIALSGARYPATAHVDEAIAKGANAVLVEGQLHTGKVHESGDAVELYLPNLRKLVGTIADRFFRSPSASVRVVGVTGTNGKTSVSHFIAQLMSANGISAGVIGTLGYGLVAEGSMLTALTHTTPNVVDVHRYLAEMRDAGAEAVAMEVSSHGLEQGRVDSVQFEGAVFTNLTRDHLDYHGTMAAYGQAKAKLFVRPELKFAVLNREDPFSVELTNRISANVRCFDFGEHAQAAIHATEVRYGSGLQAKLNYLGREKGLNSPLVGRFNLYNLMAALATVVAMDVDFEDVTGLERVHAIPGRMNILAVEGKPTVVVDYAHTPDALENILKTVKEQSPERVHVVFGCGGDRDAGKRPLMAEIAEKWADLITLTDDNPRSESPKAIFDDVMQGFHRPEVVSVCHDRRMAIEQAVLGAKPGDWVLIAGKGHEDYQEMNGQRIHFSDLEQAREVLALGSDQTGVEVHGGA